MNQVTFSYIPVLFLVLFPSGDLIATYFLIDESLQDPVKLIFSQMKMMFHNHTEFGYFLKRENIFIWIERSVLHQIFPLNQAQPNK